MNLTDLLAAIPPELRAYISDLENRALHWQQRATLLEDQFRLAQLKRYAPSSEKASGQACLFNEAEQEAVVGETEEDDPRRINPRQNRRNADVNHCRHIYHASASNTIYPKIKKSVLAARGHYI